MARLLAIGDIHGCLVQLDALVEAVQPGVDDFVIFLGDYVDRGPDSAGVLRRLIQLRRDWTPARTRFILGNHEEMMLNARMGIEQQLEWVLNGGGATLASYAGTRALMRDVPKEHWEFLENDLVPYVEMEQHIFVHASAYPQSDMRDQPGFMLRWERFEGIAPHVSGKVIVCGHTPQASGAPANRGFAICIDTHVMGEHGRLTCLDALSGKLWQADKAGRVSRAHISDFEEG